MNENPELLSGYVHQLVADARMLEADDLDGRVFITRSIFLAAFVLSNNDYATFTETLPSLVDHGEEYLERLFPNLSSTRTVRSCISGYIKPRSMAQPLPETCTDLIDGLKNGQFYFSDMPNQAYPVSAESIA